MLQAEAHPCLGRSLQIEADVPTKVPQQQIGVSVLVDVKHSGNRVASARDPDHRVGIAQKVWDLGAATIFPIQNATSLITDQQIGVAVAIQIGEDRRGVRPPVVIQIVLCDERPALGLCLLIVPIVQQLPRFRAHQHVQIPVAIQIQKSGNGAAAKVEVRKRFRDEFVLRFARQIFRARWQIFHFRHIRGEALIVAHRTLQRVRGQHWLGWPDVFRLLGSTKEPREQVSFGVPQEQISLLVAVQIHEMRHAVAHAFQPLPFLGLLLPTVRDGIVGEWVVREQTDAPAALSKE